MKIKIGDKFVDGDVVLEALKKHPEKLWLMVPLVNCINLAIGEEEKEKTKKEEINDKITEINRILNTQVYKKVFFIFCFAFLYIFVQLHY